MTIKNAEEFVYAAVEAGEIEIDTRGRLWRVAVRRRDRWGGDPKSVPCKRRAADRIHRNGYRVMHAMIDGVRMGTPSQRLVWLHFKGSIPDGLTVNHKNGKKRDNRPRNLELTTRSEQMIYTTRVLKRGMAAHQTGEANPFAKLTKREVRKIRAERARGAKLKTIAKRYGVSFQHISLVVRGLSRAAD